jgi:uncharacterized protein HemX
MSVISGSNELTVPSVRRKQQSTHCCPAPRLCWLHLVATVLGAAIFGVGRFQSSHSSARFWAMEQTLSVTRDKITRAEGSHRARARSIPILQERSVKLEVSTANSGGLSLRRGALRAMLRGPR